ncbi:cation diffusion facilitator family transporter [Ottowia sp.]|uniref:cation diffusion facilitator family transporter n=1 Tax=Ottowia sp. TaxID=1898956 RepID=UPI002B9E4C64|nr:cation diffusion facilitator family transporter [Ottowia sp.]HRN75091.1 cation diffusion facilitator family transporter [Ottowia sp.]HRQ03372.1 cation diffusion facilitator family transporter [Ottowia sp.]
MTPFHSSHSDAHRAHAGASSHPRESAHEHGHEHGHGHGHPHAPRDFSRAFAVGIVLNLAFVGVEAFYGWRVNSLALLADAAHNLSDVAGLVLAWGGAWAARIRPDARHTYGWQRASILAAFANAVLLLVAMGSLGWEAVQRLGDPRPTQGWTIITVAAIGIVINTATALLFMRGRESDINIQGAFLHMAADALVSVGVVVGGALYLWQGWGWLDPVMSLVIALVIVWGTWGLLRESTHLLFDGVPAQVDAAAVRAYLAALPGVARVHDPHIWAMSTTQVALSAHLIVPAGQAGDALLHEASQDLTAHYHIDHVTLQLSTEAIQPMCDAAPD